MLSRCRDLLNPHCAKKPDTTTHLRCPASLAYAIAIVLVNMALVYSLYRRGLFLRLCTLVDVRSATSPYRMMEGCRKNTETTRCGRPICGRQTHQLRKPALPNRRGHQTAGSSPHLPMVFPILSEKTCQHGNAPASQRCGYYGRLDLSHGQELDGVGFTSVLPRTRPDLPTILFERCPQQRREPRVRSC